MIMNILSGVVLIMILWIVISQHALEVSWAHLVAPLVRLIIRLCTQKPIIPLLAIEK